jgi:hypothetical protein
MLAAATSDLLPTDREEAPATSRDVSQEQSGRPAKTPCAGEKALRYRRPLWGRRTLVLLLPLALWATPAKSAPQERPGCEKHLTEVAAGVAAAQAQLKSLGGVRGSVICHTTRLYFLEVVKERAVTALCKTDTERDRELGRLDAEVEQTNTAIASNCTE